VTLPHGARTRSAPLDATAAFGETATGLPPKVAATLAYAAWWLTGLLFLAAEPRNPFVRHHARQAVVVFGVLWLAGVGLWALSFVGIFLSPTSFWVTTVLAQTTWILGVALWIVCLVQAARGRWWAVPFARRNPRI
jgi:uncharacterized membrane protein